MLGAVPRADPARRARPGCSPRTTRRARASSSAPTAPRSPTRAGALLARAARSASSSRAGAGRRCRRSVARPRPPRRRRRLRARPLRAAARRPTRAGSPTCSSSRRTPAGVGLAVRDRLARAAAATAELTPRATSRPRRGVVPAGWRSCPPGADGSGATGERTPHSRTVSLRPRIARSSRNSMSPGVAAQPVDGRLRHQQPVRRALRHALDARRRCSRCRRSPCTPGAARSRRCRRSTSPVLSPTPMRNGGLARAARSRLKRSSRVEHVARGAQRAVGVVGLVERRAEHGHDPVAHVRDERAARVEDRVGHLAEVAVEDVDHVRRRARLGVRREAAQVAEEHRRVALLAAEAQLLVGVRDDLVDDLLRDEAREQVVDAAPVGRLGEQQRREREDRRQHERGQRQRDRQHAPAVERDLRDDEVDARRARARRGSRRAAAPHAREREAPHAERRRDQREQRPSAGSRASRARAAAGSRRGSSGSPPPAARGPASARCRTSTSPTGPAGSARPRRRRRPCR